MFSERWKCRFRDPNFKNFPGGDTHGPPTVVAVCVHLTHGQNTTLGSMTIQFRLIFKGKGHKSLEYCCLVIHLTSVISTISNAESNGGIFILIAPLGIN